MGVILNNVKSEEGPEYYRYHSHYYYGYSATPKKKHDLKSKVHNFVKSGIKQNIVRLLLLIVAVALVLVVIFWQDINYTIDDRLISFKHFFRSN